MQKYQTILNEINREIDGFNLLLKAEFKIPELGISGESWFPVTNLPFAKISHPYNRFPGVYILCACHEKNPLRVGAYIGKSSGTRVAMGWRLDNHFRPGKVTNIHRMPDPYGEQFIIEAISAIGIRQPNMRTFASALEEFIIDGVKGRIHLLNRSRNSRPKALLPETPN